ncbi:MAG: DNA mismatch repair endonuclease MutL [Candidatus Omnitrophica bacterium]|nr:DNA mismatch repair endonuclease MutL [Candidatus Omnitrophota bacterium]MCM8798797.1 DNA mismatch repair endonuclease MutL [Candidatus Omnitrophota bacterium]
MAEEVKMNKRIIILPPEIVNKIAAGEVVERPASVVKELVENSLDAEANLIEVEIKDAGIKSIKVTDNGTGMGKDDALICTQPHATSKISSLEDLEKISTLGFRGEALSSIASVSLMRIITHNVKESSGIELEIEAGEIKNVREIGSPQGTTVEVKNLFFNTPARRKFLKSPATELTHIIRIMEQFALAYPEVNFRLFHQEKELFNFIPQKEVKERIKDVLGKEWAENWLELSFKENNLKISGFISKPNFSRLDRYGQFFFVNRRTVVNKTLSHALAVVYQELLPKERFPVAIIYIEIEPHLVDVNVHPTKREIRFQNESLIHNYLVKAIKEALTKNSLLSEIRDEDSTSFLQKVKEEAPPYSLFKENFSSQVKGSPLLEISLFRKAPFLQLKDLYIVTADEEGILIIDQHAASERIIFAGLAEAEEKKEVQRLLIPEVVDLGLKESQIIKENLEELRNLGFELEEFGKNSFQIKAIPAIISKSPKQLILDIVSEIQEDKTIRLEREKLLSLIACHSAVREGDSLEETQIARLIQDLKNTKFPWVCPHGRPTMIRLSWEELRKRFRRC